MAFLPYKVNTLIAHDPWANVGIILITSAVSIAVFAGVFREDTVRSLMLSGWNFSGLFGHMLLHGGVGHLLGNMIALWVFGNAISGIMSAAGYAFLYVALGLLAAVAHNVFDGNMALGASGAVCGIMGVYLAVYPTNHVSCLWVWFARGGSFEIPGWLLIGGYFVLDVFGAFGQSNVAHWAHLGGTVMDFGIGLLMVKFGKIHIGDYDHPTVLSLFSRQKEG